MSRPSPSAPYAGNPYASPQPGRGAPDLSFLGGGAERCRQHPDVQAVSRCASCHAPICGTCDFVFPGNLHLCPSCATTTSQPLTSSRKTMLGWSFAAVIWVTLFLAALMSGAMEGMVTDEMGAQLVGTAILLPGLIGLGLSIASLDKRAGNPPIVWVAVVWNSVMFGIFMILCFVGLTME